MSKEIKFRAWVPQFESYGEVLNIFFSEEGLPEIIEVFIDGSNHHLNAFEVILEQYTGLKDKNGKKICEGDIMAQTLVDDPFRKKYPNYVVHWDEEFLSWELKDVSGDNWNDTELHFFIEEWKKCEVIGNIHENPELLEKGEYNG